MGTRTSGTISGQFVTMYVSDCPSCGVLYGIATEYENRRRADGKQFYCPNGHTMGWSPDNAAEKIRKLEAQLTAKGDQLQAAVHEAETVRVALLRDRQRFANGVCPCCNRSFENVRRHMTDRHPDYDTTRVAQSSAMRFSCSCGRSFESLRGLRIHQGWSRSEGWDSPQTSRWSAHLTKV